jgi:hypothetical protein
MSSTSFFSIRIEGDFIDSFLYSGTLFLVHADSKITTHAWESLLDSSIEASWNSNSIQATVSFLKDYRKALTPTDINQSIFIENKNLIEHQQCSLQLSGWPTDINIYSNRFYIADEKGVGELNFNYKNRTLDEDSRFEIYNSYAYKISPNEGHRIAIAAGLNGVIAAYPRSDYPDFPLIDVDAHDCEWIGENLTTNSLSGAFLLKFCELPKRPDGKISPDYWETYKDAITAPPISKKEVVSEIDGLNPYVWVAGSKIFQFYENGYLLVRDAEQNDTKIHINQFELSSHYLDNQHSGVRIDHRILSARTSLFGTVIEIGDFLYLVTEDGIEELSHRPVSWRVFPRSKSYLNQLHIVENDSLIIRAYSPQADKSIINRFGITFDEAI